MKKKRLRLKKKILISMIIFIIGITIIIMPYFLINIELYGDDKMVLDYGEKYSEPGYRGNILSDDITSEIKVSDNIKDDVGTYIVKYNYKALFYNKTKERIVQVSDLSGPKITLEGDKNIEVTINTEYKEPGFTAIDNLDGDLTKEVKVSDNIDTLTLGDYVVEYEVVDNTGNKTTVKRNVKVERKRPTQMSIKDYTLKDWYQDAYLKQTKDMGDEYYNSFKIVGDSNIMNLYLTGNLKGENAWAIPCLHAESMFTTELNIYGLGIKIKLLDAVEKYKPKRIIIDFGTFSTSWIKEDVFLKNANAMIDKIQEINPDTEIVLMSIYPIAKWLDNKKFSQNTINKYNFYLLEMAHEHKIKFLDVQSVLKGSDGYGSPMYILDDGYHLTTAGHRLVKQYIKTHGLEKE